MNLDSEVYCAVDSQASSSHTTWRKQCYYSQLQKKLREDNIDVDAAIDALYKSKSMKPPDKLKEAATYVAPLVDEFLHAEHHQEL